MAEGLQAACRTAARQRRIPKDAHCAVCGFADPVALEAWGKSWRCYECGNTARGRNVMEAHHILGKDVDSMTVDVNANLHRILSDAQLDIPDEVKRSAPGNPLAWVIRLLCAMRDFAQAIVAFLGAAIDWLARLLAELERRFGQEWSATLGLPPSPFAPVA